MSGASVDGGAESDQFMSLPGTPAPEDGDDDDPFSWKGKSVHNYYVFWWLISATAARLRFVPHTSARFRDVPRALYTPRSDEW